MANLLAPEILLKAYSKGFFPMAASKDGEIYWHFPENRAIFPIYSIKPDRSLRKSLEKSNFSYTINRRFEYVIEQCADREDTWISNEIIDAYCDLHYLGYAHSIETWQDGRLVGGLYGVAIGGAFFGESMFNSVSNASKAAFYYLIEHLKRHQYILLDSQYINSFTQQLGAIDVSRDEYLKLLNQALKKNCSFTNQIATS